MPSAFIPDGYTRDAVIPQTPQYDEIRITYRPMLRAERNRLLFRTLKLRESSDERALKEAEKITVESVAAHLTYWNVVDAAETTVPINAANLARINPNAFEAIYNVVAGYTDAEEAADAKN